MELPNYSQQLLQQLYALCREQQFCDCSVLVGTAHFRAHKLILAAASLLFRSALDGADTVSIDASLVAPDDFALLLEMIYTGKLPLGKHHFSKVISVADSLQMFDVAVSCKTLLRELLSCSSQDQGPLRDSSLPTANASGETTAPINQPQAAKLSNEVGAHSGQVSPSPAATTGDPARVQEQSLRSAVAGEKASDEERMLFAASQSQNSEVLTSSPSPGGQSVFEEGESTEPSGGEKDLIRGAGGSSKAASQDSLLCSEPVFSKVLSNIPAVLERLAECTEIEASLKEAILACCEGNSPWEAVENLIKTMVKEKTLKAESLMRLLGALEAPFPGLRLLLDQWEAAAGGGDGRGLLMEGGGEKSGAWQRKVTGASQAEVAGEGEQKARRSPGPSGGAASKKGLACRACRKSFHFFCRLKVHEKRCRVANQRQVQCQGCSETRASQRELEKHQGEAHRRPGSAAATKRQKKKQRRLPVACDICGREFAHASGMQYHKLTEHFDEKPFTCEECGAKFAANSTLRNHQRLHSGDRPFVCKHCLAAFSQASALAYHAKRKHAEGKMYACQYCTAVFAQSIELSRHVRTHTGDKPYVCRECGKGFRQANGLSIHLRTFHNIDDPYDCKKCQMSFPTLQEHQQHIHAAHSREYHPCPTCGKVFSAPSLLERHMVTHVGGKPFSCEVCNKAYQQLSGLWYHNRTHHPDIFAAQNHRSSKFSSLQCSSCDKTFSSTAAYRKHAKEDHAGVTFYECEKCKGLFPTLTLLQAHMKYRHSGSPPFHCLHCSASFHLQGALQNHVASEHTLQAERSLGCGLCGELFSEQEQLEEHCGTEHPKVVFADAKVPAAHIVQVIQAPEQVITLAESELTGSQVFLTLPDSQGHPSGRAELVTVTMEDLLNEKVTLICQEAK